MTYQSFTVSRFIDDDADHGTTFTVSDDDAINCAHMLAAGFNTMSRNMMGDFVLAVVDTKAGTVQYGGKAETIEQSKAADLWSFSKTFLAREVLESAYEELQAVKEVLADAGVETIPADAGATDLRAVLRARDIEIDELKAENEELHKRDKFEQFARSSMERKHFEQNEEARIELISFVKRAHAKKVRLQTAVPDGDGRPELDDRWRGMLDVLAKFLVITGEADADEGHAVARRLCEIED
jgi:hypothetical protein